MEATAVLILPVLASIAAFFIVGKINDVDKSIEQLSKKVDYQGKRLTDHVDKIREDHHDVRNKMIDVQREQNRELARIKSEQLILKSDSNKYAKLFNVVFKVADKHEKIITYWKKKKE